jgi:glycerate kinase
MSVPSIRQLFYESGQSLQIHANPLARGGEGTVHTISSSDEYLVKI